MQPPRKLLRPGMRSIGSLLPHSSQKKPGCTPKLAPIQRNHTENIVWWNASKNLTKSSPCYFPQFQEPYQLTTPASTSASPWICRTDVANHASTPSRLARVVTPCASRLSEFAASTATLTVESPAGYTKMPPRVPS